MIPAGFADPDDRHRPRVRWWWPGGAVSGESLAGELRAIRDAGFARAEIALLPMGLPDAVDRDAVRTWGTRRFTERLADALAAARANGMRLDLTVSPGWPLASPAVTGERIDLAARKLVRGHVVVAAGEVLTEIPRPEGEPADDRLVAVTATRLSDVDTLVPDSAVDLTDGLPWTAPASGSWLVFSFWSRQVGQRSLADACAQDALVIDHFSREAAEVALAHIDAHVLPPSLDTLLEEAGGDLFEDSLELASDAEWWTASLLTEFARRRGYDLTPHLAVLRVDRLYRFDWETLLAGITPESPAEYDYPDGLGRRIRHDYYRTLNELYVDNHVTPLTRWANRRGLRYRAQPYGNTMDHVEIAASVQIPESEDLVSWIAAGGMTDGPPAYDRAVDFHRGIASAAHMQGRDTVSLECCAVIGADYQTDLGALKRHVDMAFCGGVNQLVLHGFPYSDVVGAAWPGWAPFSNDSSPEVSEAWGPRQPMWRHMRSFADYVARASAVLRHGRPRVDVAVYKHDYWVSSWPKITTSDLADAGFTHGFLSPSLLELESAVVRDGRLGNAGYRALVVDNETAIEPPALRRILALAQSGLPVVVVGSVPLRAKGFVDADVPGVVSALLALPNVHRVDDQKHVSGALLAAGVRPDARLRDAANILTVHRETPEGSYYYLFNTGATRCRFTAEFAESGDTWVLDLWNGTSHPVSGDSFELGPAESLVVFTGLDAVPAAGLAPGTPVTDGWVLEPAGWELEAEDWGPDGHSVHRVSGLVDWREIPGVESGVGTYRVTVRLEPGWDSVDGVLLDLGRVAGTMRVRVNGQVASADCVALRPLDVRPYLRDGDNAVEVEVATTLGNRMISLGKQGEAAYQRFATREPRPAGLLGPVLLRGVLSR